MSRPADQGPTDAELVGRARRGDADAFDLLARRHYRAAYAVAYARLGERADAEDVVQDALVRALERLDDCEPAAFAGWLLAIVRNRAHNHREYLAVRSGPPADEAGAAAAGQASDLAHRHDLAAKLAAALATLTPPQREVVLLHDLEGLTHREIAGRVGCSEGMSRQHLFTARKALRARLGARLLEDYAR